MTVLRFVLPMPGLKGITFISQVIFLRPDRVWLDFKVFSVMRTSFQRFGNIWLMAGTHLASPRKRGHWGITWAGLRVCACSWWMQGAPAMVCMCYRQGHQQSKPAGASSSQARRNPRTSLSALDCGCDAPALPVGYNKLWPGTVSQYTSFCLKFLWVRVSS